MSGSPLNAHSAHSKVVVLRRTSHDFGRQPERVVDVAALRGERVHRGEPKVCAGTSAAQVARGESRGSVLQAQRSVVVPVTLARLFFSKMLADLRSLWMIGGDVECKKYMPVPWCRVCVCVRACVCVCVCVCVWSVRTEAGGAGQQKGEARVRGSPLAMSRAMVILVDRSTSFFFRSRRKWRRSPSGKYSITSDSGVLQNPRLLVV